MILGMIISMNIYFDYVKPLLLTWYDFNPSMDK